MSKSQPIEEDSSSGPKKEYTEKIWTNNNGKIDGYTFKGKRLFSRALIGLKRIMIKGKSNEVGKVKFTALDTKIQGAGLDIDVQVHNNKNRGNAVLKIYGPKEDIKKDNTVTVSKSKESDSKFIVILAEKVIVPLMDGFLSGDIKVPDCESNSIKEGSELEAKQFSCSFCDKTFKSARGLKTHTTKMHLSAQSAYEEQETPIKEQNKRKASEDICDVVESLLTEVVNISDKGFTTEEIVLDDRDVKKYTKMCNNCDFQVEANKNYISVQKILQHRDQCNYRIPCFQCDKKFKEQLALKRHMRNEHSIISGSISPPCKKKKVDIKEVTSTLDDSIETMDIDVIVDQEEEILKQREKLMDEKAIAKQKKDEQEVQAFLEKKAEKKKKEEDSIKERKKQQLKSKKQKIKNNHKGNVNKIPNIRNIPEDLIGFFDEGDVVYVVPGDGACGPNSAAAHLFEDEIFGPKLRKNMNIFFADQFYEKYQYITSCSPESPFKRNIKGKNIQITDPEDLIKFLRTSEDAQYMWSDSEDLAIIADMYQMRIKIITVNRKNDGKPTVNWIYPDVNLAKHAELKEVEIKDMILLHEDDNHFNLVVSKNSNLATYGSLSYRHNIGPLDVKNNLNDSLAVENNQKEVNVEKEKKKDNSSEITALKKKLKECQESNKRLEKSYNECEIELRTKTEEVEKLKVEINDLKQIVELEHKQDEKEFEEKQSEYKSCSDCNFKCRYQPSLKKHIEDKHMELELNKHKNVDYKFSCLECEFQTTTEAKLESHINKHKENLIKCVKCDFKTQTQKHLNEHIDEKHVEFNCEECPFQATKQLELNKHINLKHRSKGQTMEDVIVCKHCGEQFSEIWNLMNHRKQFHRSTVAFCKNKILDTCRFTSEKCWWNHERNDSSQNTNIVECFICNQTFKTKSAMMIHRKHNHANLVKTCDNFIKSKCTFKEEFCWFKHDNEKMDIEDKDDEHEKGEEFNKNSSVFRNATPNLIPK